MSNGGRKLNKKKKKELDWALGVIFALIGLVIWYKFFPDNWILFFVFLITGKILPTLLLNMITDKSPKNTTSKKPTKSSKTVKSTSKIGTSITSSNRLLPDDEILKLQLDEMSWREFEQLCYMYYKSKGYKPRLTKDGADGGVDLIYYSPYHKAEVAVQIKHRIGSGNQIEAKLIRELVAAKRNHNCILAEFITTSGYSNTALAEAGDRKIQCHDLSWVENKIIKWKNEEAKKKRLAN